MVGWHKLISLAALCALLTLTGCGDGAEPSVPAARSLTLPVGATPPALPMLVSSAPLSKSALRLVPPIGAMPADTLRTRLVELDLGVLPDAAALRGAASGRPVRVAIRFFEDATVVVDLTRAEATGSGGMAYTGHVAGVPDSAVVLVNNAGQVSMAVFSSEAHYGVQGSAQGYVARQLQPRALPTHPRPPIEVNAPPLPAPAGDRKSTQAVAARDDGSTVDVMVLYTPASRAQNGGTPQMQANIDAEIALTNAAYANSGVVQRLRLVHRQEMPHTEVNMDADLTSLADPADGTLDDVQVLRDLYRADVVSLWGVYSDGCGIGYLMATESSGFEGNAFNIVNAPVCTGSAASANAFTFAHELGHNMGLRHDTFVDPGNTTVTPEAGGASTTIGYAHGHVDTVNRFITIMSYRDRCTQAGVGCARIPHFSNPSIAFDNRGFHPGASPAPTGVAGTAHERQALNDTRETVANFRTGLSSLTGPGVLSFIPVAYRVGEGAGTVQLTVTRHVGTSGAVTVSYQTADGTGLAGVDYTATSGVLAWGDGDTSPRTITVPVLQDTVFEGDRSFQVVLSGAGGGASVGSVGGVSMQATVTVADDESDNFPPACSLPAGWSTPAGATTGWSVATDRVLSGTCSLKANAMANAPSGGFNRARIQFTGEFAAANLSFWRRVSSEAGFDCFRFLVDGVEQAVGGTCESSGGLGASGETGWGLVTVALTAGTHTLTWSYDKDDSFTSGSDAAWIDGVSLPLAADFPGSPTLTRVASGVHGGSVSVGFAAPASPGASAITAYTATCSAAGQPDRSATGAGSPLIVVGLAAGTATRCRVVATNGRGTGPASALSDAVLPLAAGADLSKDFDSDNQPDILWQNSATGDRYLWFMNGASFRADTSLGVVPVAWQMAGSGDFNGDGRPDILWQNTATGDRYVWFMNGGSFLGDAGLGRVPTAWQIAATGDLNADGWTDIIWQHSTTGDRYVWFMRGMQYIGDASLGRVGTEWSIVGTGDFNADGRPDLVWQNETNGARYVWYLNGAVPAGGASLGVMPVEWRLTGCADHNADGRPDLRWEHATTGERYLWFMNGTSTSGGRSLGSVAPAWQIVR